MSPNIRLAASPPPRALTGWKPSRPVDLSELLPALSLAIGPLLVTLGLLALLS